MKEYNWKRPQEIMPKARKQILIKEMTTDSKYPQYYLAYLPDAGQLSLLAAAFDQLVARPVWFIPEVEHTIIKEIDFCQWWDYYTNEDSKK